MKARELGCVLAAVALCFAARIGLARAQPVSDSQRDIAAETLRARGNESMDAQRYEKAVDLYARAYAISKDPALLYNQGRAMHLLGRYASALDHLERFAAEAPDQVKERVPGLAHMIAELKAKV